MPPSPLLLELHAVSHAHDGASVLRELTLAFPPATFNALVGDAGCGAIVRIAGLREVPDAGDVLIGEQSTAALGDAERMDFRHRHFGYLFAAPYLLPAMAVLENVAVPLFKIAEVGVKEARERTDEVLDFAGLAGGEHINVGELTLAQQQRVALARALVLRPAFLIVDHADATATPGEAASFLALLRTVPARFGASVIAALSWPFAATTGDRMVSVRDWYGVRRFASLASGREFAILSRHMASGTAEQITRASKSNLALAFVALSPERRRDITTFYGFCRVVDDLADEPGPSVAERHAALDVWEASLTAPQPGESPLAEDVRALIAKYGLPVEHFLEIIFGCEMDLRGTTYETWEDLRLYCHRVASVVGLVSIEIFGYTDPACREYAVNLGLALQLTNILRDVGEDYHKDGRVYLPRAEMEQFGYDVGRLALGIHDEAFCDLMEFEAERARAYFASARASLPPPDRRAMVSAEIMRDVYSRLLAKMARDHFRVFTHRYRLSRWEKIMCVVRGRFGRRS